MDEEFQTYISKIQSQLQEDLDVARICFESMIENFEFGSFLLEKCHSNNTNEYKNAILCFKAWIHNFWFEDISNEDKEQIIQTLFELITLKKSISPYIFDIFIFIIKHDTVLQESFQEKLEFFFESFEFDDKFLEMNLLIFLFQLFSYSAGKMNYYSLFKQYYYPMFEDPTLIENQDEISNQIFGYLIKCFSALFFNIDTEMNDIILPIEFCEYVLSNSDNTRLVSRCTKFFRSCFINIKTHDFLEGNFDEILDIHVNNFERFIQNGNDEIVYKFLRTIHIYGVRPDCFELFIESAALTVENIKEFYSNPFYFYKVFYSSSLKTEARGFAIMALDSLLYKYPDLIELLNNFEVNELSMRIFGLLSTQTIRKNEKFLEIRQNFIETILPIKFEDSIEVSSKIYLILNSIDCKLFDDSYLIELFFEYFDIENEVIDSLLCKLISKMKVFHSEMPMKILDFIQICQNSTAMKALNQISKKQPDILHELSETIILINKTSIKNEFNLIEENNNDIDFDINGIIDCNLTTLNSLIESVLIFVSLDEILWIIDHLLKYDFDEDTLYKHVSLFINNIFKACSNSHENDEIKYDLISSNVMICVLDNFNNFEFKDFFVDNFGIVFLFAISNNKKIFLDLDVSESLVESCIDILNPDSPPILTICDIISFIIQVDNSIDCEPLINFCLQLFNEDEGDDEAINPLFYLGFSNILASIVAVGNDASKLISPDIFLSLFEKNYYVRVYDKHLTAIALNSFEDKSLKDAAKELFKLEENQRNMDEVDWYRYVDELDIPIAIAGTEDYDFLAPVQMQ